MENIYGRKSVFNSITWKLFERSSSLAVTFGVTMVLARLLEPSDFGLVAMVMVFVSLSNIFVTSGLGNALIQKKNSDELDFSSMFWLNFFVSIVLYCVLFLVAPFIAGFYNYPQLITILRVLSLSLIIAGINSIQTAFISKNMMFKYYFFSTLSGKIASGILGIVLAFLGFGVWALVAQSLSVTFFETIILWFKVKWRPQKKFSLERVKTLYSFAWKIMLMSFIEAINDQLRNMFIGKKYSSDDLAYYDKGRLLPVNIITNIASSLSAVIFPVLSNSQDDKEKILLMCRRWTNIFSYCALPILAGMIVTAKAIIIILFSAKWLASIPFLQIACGMYMGWVIEVPIRETIKSLGHVDICLKMQIMKTIFSLMVLLSVMNYGVMAIALSGLVCVVFNIAVSAFYGNKYIHYKLAFLLSDIFPAFALSVFMGLVVSVTSLIPLPIFVVLVIQIIVGIVAYISTSIVTRNQSFQYCLQLIKGIKK